MGRSVKNSALSPKAYTKDNPLGNALTIDKLAVLLTPHGYLITSSIESPSFGKIIDAIGRTICCVQVNEYEILMYDVKMYIVEEPGELKKLNDALTECIRVLPEWMEQQESTMDDLVDARAAKALEAAALAAKEEVKHDPPPVSNRRPLRRWIRITPTRSTRVSYRHRLRGGVMKKKG